MITIYDLKDSFHYAMHGMGEYRGFCHTNSKEAFSFWYQRGIRIFEVDVAETDDREFVCIAHHLDYKTLKRLGIKDIPDSPNSAWFLRQKLLPRLTGGLTPLSLRNLTELLREHGDLILMMDLFGQFSEGTMARFACRMNELTADDLQLRKRVLVEVYNKDMLDEVRGNCSDIHIIYGIDGGDRRCDYTVSAGQLREWGIEFVSFPWHYRTKYPGRLQELTNSGMTVFSRTIDNLREKALRSAGVNVMLIDTYYRSIKRRIYTRMRFVCDLIYSACKRKVDGFLAQQ